MLKKITKKQLEEAKKISPFLWDAHLSKDGRMIYYTPTEKLIDFFEKLSSLTKDENKKESKPS